LLASTTTTLPTLVLGECTCDAVEEEESNKSEALKYKAAAIASIFLLPVKNLKIAV